MKNNFKVGQLVRVKKNFWKIKDEMPFYNMRPCPGSMAILIGKTLEIEKIHFNGSIETKQGALGKHIDTNWIWDSEWLEPALLYGFSVFIKRKTETEKETTEKETTQKALAYIIEKCAFCEYSEMLLLKSFENDTQEEILSAAKKLGFKN